ncbi:MAG: class I SAM-dependent methyltransferase [Bacteroidota bacterium]
MDQKPLKLEERGLSFDGKVLYPFINGAYRLVPEKNYTDSFGFQWNKFPKTQIDRFSKQLEQSSERFWKETGWAKKDLEGKNVLEVGSGAGRFTQILLEESGANIYSVDYSSAVEANYKNNGPNNRLKLFQASVYELPFEEKQFDYVLCLGVLQHTPDFEKSVECLAKMVKPGGEIAIDFYEQRGWYTKIHSKYIFRPITKRLDHKSLLRMIEKNANWLIRLYKFLYSFHIGFMTRFIPICDIRNTLPSDIEGETLKEWVILDTFDMLSPAHDHPQSISRVKGWLSKLMRVNFAGHVFLNSGQAAVIRATGM